MPKVVCWKCGDDRLYCAVCGEREIACLCAGGWDPVDCEVCEEEDDAD